MLIGRTAVLIGQFKILTFSGALTLTYNSGSLILPTSANITTAAGDVGAFVYLGSGNWKALFYAPATGAALSTTGLNLGASAMGNSAQGFNAPINASLLASITGDQLTVNLVGVNGSNASSTNPILIQFRSQTGDNTTSAVVTGSLQAALSMTLGATDSCTTAVVCRLWVTAICQTEGSNACSSILLGLSDQSRPGRFSRSTRQSCNRPAPARPAARRSARSRRRSRAWAARRSASSAMSK
jgi:hypothetical protein